jgi:serine/threonine protein kinase
MEGAIIDDFENLERFASGGFSRVHFARHIPTSTYCAAKIVEFTRDDLCNTSMHEVSVFLQVSHPYLCKLYHLARIKTHLIYFLEFVPNGTLKQYLDLFPSGIPEPEARRIFAQLHSVLLHCHRFHYLAHRDVKLENVLLDHDMNVKLIDFGLSDSFSPGGLRGELGTPGYWAPEVLSGGVYDEKCDVWSLGVCLYRMVTNECPFPSKTNSHSELSDAAKKLRIPDRLSPHLRDLLHRMLTDDVKQRPSLSDLLNHRFLKSGPDHLAKPERILPKAVVFYPAKQCEDVARLRRNPVPPRVALVQTCLKFITGDAHSLVTALEEGVMNPATATYFALLDPLGEKPQLPGPKLPPLGRQMTPVEGAGRPPIRPVAAGRRPSLVQRGLLLRELRSSFRGVRSNPAI